MLINTKKELYRYLDEVDTTDKRTCELDSVYFLVEYDDKKEPIYFVHVEDMWMASPCVLYSYPMEDEEVENYVLDTYETTKDSSDFEEIYKYESKFQRGNKHYEIYVPLCLDYLPNKLNIVDILSEEECLDWLIKEEEMNMGVQN